jgi:hypothetical protein
MSDWKRASATPSPHPYEYKRAEDDSQSSDTEEFGEEEEEEEEEDDEDEDEVVRSDTDEEVSMKHKENRGQGDEDDGDEEDGDEDNDAKEIADRHTTLAENGDLSPHPIQAANQDYILEGAVGTPMQARRSSNENATIAALLKYYKQQSLHDLRIITSGNIPIPADDLAQLLSPGRCDVSVRAYLRSVSEGAEFRRIDKDAHQASRLLCSVMEGMLQDQSPSSLSDDWRSSTLPALQYALARAYLASGRSDNIVRARNLLLEVLEDPAAAGDADLIAPMQCSLIQALHMLGEIHNAKYLLEKMLHEMTAVRGESNAHVLELRLALAAACGMEQQIPKALSLLQELLQLQAKIYGTHHPSLLVSLHLMLSFQVKARHDAEARATLCSMNELLEKFGYQPLLEEVSSLHPTHPAQQASMPPTGQRDTASNSTYFLNDTESLERSVDRMIKSLPPDVSVPPGLQERITAYIEGSLTSSTSELELLGVPGTPTPPADSAHSIPRSCGTSNIPASASATLDGLVVASSAAAASAPGPIVIGAAALTASGAIGMAAASIWRLFIIDLPKLALGREANQSDKDKAYAETQNKMLATINELAVAEEAAALKANDLKALEHINMRYVEDLKRFRLQLDCSQSARAVDRLAAERASHALKKKDETIELLRKELRLKDLKLELNKTNQQQRSPSSGQSIKMLELSNSTWKREQEAKQVQEAKRVQEAELAAASAAEARASRAAAKSSELVIATRKIVESQQSKIGALEAQLVDARRECNELSERLSRCKCGDPPGIEDQPPEDADSKMREEGPRSAVEALRTRLAREDFAVHEGPFLDRLDSTRGLDAVVRALCDRLGDFIPALYHDLIPYGEQQRALAKKDTAN